MGMDAIMPTATQRTGLTFGREPDFEVVIDADPAPQGSKRHVGKGKVVEVSKKFEPWRKASALSLAVEISRREGWAPLDGPLFAAVDFWLPRPASKPATKVVLPTGFPDVDKLVRGAFDPLTIGRAIKDDRLFVDFDASKRYAPTDDRHRVVGDMDTVGAHIMLWALDGGLGGREWMPTATERAALTFGRSPDFETFIEGDPAPQGSKRHVGNGRLIEASNKFVPWRKDTSAALAAEIDARIGWAPLTGPLFVAVDFWLDRPKNKPVGKFVHASGFPDVDKLARGILDPLTQGYAIADDKFVVDLVAGKRYVPTDDRHRLPGDSEVRGARVMVWELSRGVGRVA